VCTQVFAVFPSFLPSFLPSFRLFNLDDLSLPLRTSLSRSLQQAFRADIQFFLLFIHFLLRVPFLART